jgi:alkanesulfonate monooxygenase SsuD/methylene tetrahydromethanopterin reductase-like flavin-dependent oxidoreductase (luciferase family)
MSRPRQQIHLAARLPGTPGGTRQPDFELLRSLASIAERAGFDFLLHGAGTDPVAELAALAAVTERLGLVGAIDPARSEPYDAARRFTSLDHISAGRAGWFPGVRGTDHPPQEQQHRTPAFARAAQTIAGSWHPDAVLGDRAAGRFLAEPRPGRFAIRDRFFEIEGQFNVPRSPQGSPVLLQAVDGEAELDAAAALADAAVVTRQQTEAADFRRRLDERLAEHGRPPDSFPVLCTATIVLAGSDEEAREIAGDDGVPEHGFVGSPRTVADAIADLVARRAADGFILIPHRAPDDLALFADHVVPLLRDRALFRSEYTGRTLREHLGLGPPRPDL